MAAPKVIVMGLDGMTPELVERWMREGKLPNLATVAQNGAYGRLLSTIPPSSPQAWSAALTGKNPGKHGIFGFTHRGADAYSPCLTTSNDREGPDLGQIIAHWGQGSGFLFVPLTYPPYPVNGFVVSGMGTPGPKSSFAYPPELKGELLREFNAEHLFEPPIVDQEPAEYFREIEDSVGKNHAVFEWLQTRFPDLDCYMIVYTAPDRIQHCAWHYMDPGSSGYEAASSAELGLSILRVYQQVDKVVGRMASTLHPDTTLILMSDHGAGPYRKFVDLNAWLAREGYLAFAEAAPERSDRFFSQLYRLWRRGPRRLFSAWQRRYLKEWLPKGLKTRVDAEWRSPLMSHVEWSNTRAFSEGTEGQISLNMCGREPEGVVHPEDRNQILAEIEAGLHRLKDPETGRSVVDRVWRREQVYHGQALEKAPDLIVQWSEEQYHSRALWNPRGGVMLDPGKWKSTRMVLSGHHRREGVIFATGPFVSPGTSVKGAGIVDIAPTILTIMGLPLLPDFDGRALDELTVGIESTKVEEAGLGHPPDGESEVYSEGETKQVEDLLRGLGYIE
jgi:predicted AlkP superfamily phosphohydrolase/phosphomutase